MTALSSGTPGLALRVLGAWGDLRGATRALLDARPSEALLLSFALLSGFLWFLGQVARLWLAPGTGAMAPDVLIGRVAAEFVGAMLFRTLALYGLAALVRLVARAFGGTGTWRDARAAVFWAFLVAAPVVLVAGLGALVLPEPVRAVAGSLGSVALAVALAHGIAEAEGFRRPWAVLAVVGGASLAVLSLLVLA